MKLISEWREAWRWFSMHAFALIAVIPIVWMGLPPDVKSMVPDSWDKWVFVVIAVAGGVGRLVDQGTAKPPAP